MSINIPSWYVTQFATNIALLLQQKGSILSDLVETGSYTGEQASPVDQLAAIAANEVVSRFAPMARVDASVDRRWVFPRDFDLPQLIDSFDKLRLLTDPQSKYVENAVNAMGRSKDDVILEAMFADAKTGKSGSTTTSFGATLTTSGGQNVAVAQGASSPTNLTVAKLREVVRQAIANQIDLKSEQLWGVLNANNHDSLLSEAQVVSTDFNEKPVLVDGMVTRFMGVNFRLSNRLVTGTDDASGTSTMTPVFVKSGVHVGIWNDLQTSISTRNDIQGEPWQAYCKMTIGATRLEEKRVFRIWTR